jgi:LuxR family maltose regulon positive regulatory protein
MLEASPSDAWMNPILNAIALQAGPYLLVLDDFHLIQSQPVLDMVTLLVERMPRQMRLILLSRTDPPLPLARWRARGQMEEVRAGHLKLTKHEIAVFMNSLMHLPLSDEDIGALEARTEGWIAGLQLAALSMQGRPDAHDFVAAFTGSHHYIMDYLLEEVLKRQPESMRTFAPKTILGAAAICRVSSETGNGLTVRRSCRNWNAGTCFWFLIDNGTGIATITFWTCSTSISSA